MRAAKSPSRFRLTKSDGDHGSPVSHLLCAAELGGIVEVRHIGQLVSISQRRDDLLVDLITDVASAFERDQSRVKLTSGAPEVSEACRREFRVSHGVLDVSVSK
jgi:hypothetical protein